jgi:hypothetical protein
MVHFLHKPFSFHFQISKRNASHRETQKGMGKPSQLLAERAAVEGLTHRG